MSNLPAIGCIIFIVNYEADIYWPNPPHHSTSQLLYWEFPRRHPHIGSEHPDDSLQWSCVGRPPRSDPMARSAGLSSAGRSMAGKCCMRLWVLLRAESRLQSVVSGPAGSRWWGWAGLPGRTCTGPGGRRGPAPGGGRPGGGHHGEECQPGVSQQWADLTSWSSRLLLRPY